MRVNLLGTFRQVARRATWCFPLVIFVVLSAPVAFSQRAAEGDKTGITQPALETSQDVNERIAELAQASLVRQPVYVIGGGDLLGIDVFDVAELTRDVRVDESGFIGIPLIPVRVQAAGLTPAQLEDKIAEVLQANGLVTNPNVTIGVKERHSEPITVTGAVRIPTVIQAVRQMTLLEVISQAGGISSDAGNEIIITRPAQFVVPDGGSIVDGPMPASTVYIKANLNDLLYSGNLKSNIPVIGGDVVTVPHAGVVYVIGAMQRPGGFIMESDRQQMTVIRLVSLSGGWIPSAKPNDAFILRQDPDTGQRTRVPVEVKKILTLKTEDVTLRQNDILYVPDSVGKRAMRRTGEIAVSLGTGVAMYRATSIP